MFSFRPNNLLTINNIGAINIAMTANDEDKKIRVEKDAISVTNNVTMDGTVLSNMELIVFTSDVTLVRRLTLWNLL